MRVVKIQKLISDKIYNEESPYPYGVINIYDNASSSVWNNVSDLIQRRIPALNALRRELWGNK